MSLPLAGQGLASAPSVVVVGGGLAGMAAALRLAERGCDVALFEESSRLGGKAGADHNGADYDEHAYHIFPAWYRNAWRLAQELDITERFVDVSDILLLQRGKFPSGFAVWRNITSWRSAPRNILRGPLRPLEACLFYYAVCDLLSQPYRKRAYLDQITMSGFLRARIQWNERVEEQFQEIILKGLSVPAYEVSAMTMRQVFSFWVPDPLPLMRILRGNLQEHWINPIGSRLNELGCKIRTGHRLNHIEVENGRVVRLRFDTGDPSPTVLDTRDKRVIVAIPAERLAALVDDSLYQAWPELALVRYIRTAQLPAFNVYFKRRIPGIPPGHVLLAGSRFALSFMWTHSVEPSR